ncbi:hypothetical protein [Cryptosporangium japonicum]|uniref:Uncharacterized protein n=1 Tax=Cryptosporangium japonicum TaxID=80872 RepID=A0ABP3EZD9_9ACTN
MTTGNGSGNANGGGESPWARPATGSEPPVTWVPPRPPVTPSYRPYQQPAPDVVETPAAKPQLARWVIGGGALLVLGLVAVLVLASTGVFRSDNPSLFGPFAGENPEASGPPLARLCPPASENPPPGGEEPAPVEGPRITDRGSGISYLRLDAPWTLWDRGPWGQGTLGVDFETGYYFVTETYSGGDYLASVLSGKVPATVGDSLSLNLPCAGRQVAEDVRRAYYPQPNVKEQTRDEQIVVGGRPAWVSTFHLTFEANGLDARGEQVAVVLVDVGRPDAAVLYISIPDTHRQYNPEIDRIVASIQPA